MKNLGAMHDYATNALDVAMILVVAPRAYQYSDRESLDSRETKLHELVPRAHILAPFDYFEQKQHELPYRVFSLLPAFQQTSEFPLYIPYDPHWNAAGSRFAGRAIADFLLTERMVPCAH